MYGKDARPGMLSRPRLGGTNQKKSRTSAWRGLTNQN